MEGPASFTLPPIYPILDAGAVQRAGIPIEAFARELSASGVRFLQYRDKEALDAVVLERARRLRAIFPPGEATLVLNDRVHLLDASGFDGVHVGQDDLPAGEVRCRIGPGRVLGLSTHNPAQLAAAGALPVDYLAIGPVFGTRSKTDPDPVVGLEGVRAARGLTAKPLVAIGGITAENAHAVLDAGADAIALISALLPSADSAPGRTVRKLLEDFFAAIG